MHAVDIGIGGYNHLVVAQAFNAVVNVESCLQQAKLLVLIYCGRWQPKGVERLSSQREHRLGLHVANLGD